VRKAFRGIGIRIEDNVAVTRSQPQVLTADLVKTTKDIEALMAGA
jgi:Xaa-Pro aminopeptidase